VKENLLGSLVLEIVKKEDAEKWLTVVRLPRLLTPDISQTQASQHDTMKLLTSSNLFTSFRQSYQPIIIT